MDRNRLRISSDTGIEIKVHPRRGEIELDPPSPLSPARAPTDYKPFRNWVPWIVPLFVVANIFIFGISMYVNNCPKHSNSCLGRWLGRFSFQTFKENPLLGPSSSTLVKLGALEVNIVVRKHQVWRLISCIWLHAGVFHILANMLSLLLIGIRLEQEFGFVRIGLLYAISGFGGSLLSALFIKNGISVGASGALFGLLGSMLSELITNWTIYVNKLVALLSLLFIIAINLALGILPHIDNFAHIGGFVSGFLLGFVLLIRPQFRWISQRNTSWGAITTSVAKHKKYQYVLWIMSLLLLSVLFTLGLILLFRGVNMNTHCSWCRYLSCIPTSLWKCDSHERYCKMSRLGSQLNMTCQSNWKSNIYQLSDRNPSQAHLQQLCMNLCK